MSRFGNWIGKTIRKAAQVGADNQLYGALYWYMGQNQPVTYDENFDSYVENGYGGNSTLYSIVSFLSEKASAVPYKVVTRGADGEYEDATSEGADELRKLLYAPNTFQSCREMKEQLYAFYLITGNGYLYAPKLPTGANEGRTNELFVAPSQYMEIISNGWMNPVKEYRVIYGSYHKRMPYEDVMHMKKANLSFEQGSEWYGQSPLKAGNKILSKANSAEEAQMALYQNRGASGIISSDGGNMGSFTEEQAAQLRNAYKQKYSGASKTGEPMFTAAQVKWQQMVMNSRELAFDLDHNLSLRDMCNLFHVPSQLFGDPENQTYSNLQEARKAIYTDAIMPMVDSFWSEFNRWIVGAYGEDIKVMPDYSQIPEMQPDKREAAETMRIAVEAGAATKNEMRQALGLPLFDDPAADILTESVGRIPIGAEDETIEATAEKALDRMDITDYKQDSYTDYPEGATSNAKRALKYKEDKGSDCGTPVGWARANQLANREPLSLETVKRTYSFLSRAETYYDGGSLEKCGNIMYLAWGGPAMKRWAKSVLDQE